MSTELHLWSGLGDSSWSYSSRCSSPLNSNVIFELSSSFIICILESPLLKGCTKSWGSRSIESLTLKSKFASDESADHVSQNWNSYWPNFTSTGCYYFHWAFDKYITLESSSSSIATSLLSLDHNRCRDYFLDDIMGSKFGRSSVTVKSALKTSVSSQSSIDDRPESLIYLDNSTT